jgi:hypothetical protein
MVRGPCHAVQGGFDLDAGVVVPARDRAHLERVCRYALRPAIAHDRIRLTSEGDVLLELRHRWRDGTTHLRFHPLGATGTAGIVDTAAAHQSGPVLRRAGGACGMAAASAEPGAVRLRRRTAIRDPAGARRSRRGGASDSAPG